MSWNGTTWIVSEGTKVFVSPQRIENAERSRAEAEERRKSLQDWQQLWDASPKGRWTHRLIPEVSRWVNRNHGEVNYHLTQLLSGHGCFRTYLYKYNYEISPECPACNNGAIEDAEHVFFACPRFAKYRRALENDLAMGISPENLVRVMLTSEAAWHATCNFATKVLKELRAEEQKR